MLIYFHISKFNDFPRDQEKHLYETIRQQGQLLTCIFESVYVNKLLNIKFISYQYSTRSLHALREIDVFDALYTF